MPRESRIKRTATIYRVSYSYSSGWSVFENYGGWNGLQPVASGYASREDAEEECQRLNLGDGYMKEGVSR